MSNKVKKRGGELTPMLAQYQKIKAENPDCILFFRLGDFYEMFGEDAIKASKILDIVLTARNKGEHRTEMCGVPYHAVDNYLAKLTRAGKKVAICEQTSDPKLPGIVKREVVRVVTPGTTFDDNILDQKTNNYLACLYLKEDHFGVSFADITTGEFKVTEINGYESLKAELERLKPKEIILEKEFFKLKIVEKLQKEFLDTFFFPFEERGVRPEMANSAYETLTTFFKTKNLEGFGVEKLPFGIRAAGTLLRYLIDTQKSDLKHIKRLTAYLPNAYMLLDEATIRNLELVATERDGSHKGSLLGILDHTLTPMGGRLLRKWILQPLIKIDAIKNRLEGVEELYENQSLSEDLKEMLTHIHDLERILSRISLGSGSARDLIALKNSLKLIPQIKDLFANVRSPLLCYIKKNLHECAALTDLIEKAVIEDPPATLREGGIIKDGYQRKLDDLRSISKGGQDILQKIKEREIERTGITTLKIGFNKVFGYYIEISKAQSEKAPDDYRRKQTLSNAERFIIPELKEHEEKILGAEEKIIDLEYQLFQEVREKVLQEISLIQKNAYQISVIDVLHDFARIALINNYCKPEIYDGGKIMIKEGRHPVVEKLTTETRFVPNDTMLDTNEHRFLLITGPNMAGKSVYLRQIALMILMAHIGSFISAKEAKIGLVDRIFTRVGASDDLSRGQSTFMVEMQETANILNNASDRSLIILDEIGRGTSTYDGVSIAWAVTEYIHDRIRAKTLFATHYHELISVVERLSGAKNFSAMVKETMEGVIFLYKIQRGGIDRSYGIEVGRLAGLPAEVTTRAEQILEELEEGVVEKGIREQIRGKISDEQMGLFKNAAMPGGLERTHKSSRLTHPAIEALKKVDINKLTPLEALKKLDELKEKL